MREQLGQIRVEALEQIYTATSPAELEEIRVKYLGKKGALTTILRGMGTLTADERPLVGQIANEVRDTLTQEIDQRHNQVLKAERLARLQEEKLDVTLPGRQHGMGHAHPITLVMDEIREIFISMGFTVADGPEIENTYYNFDALNIPENHPCREPQDTFYINERLALRSQTSTAQIRVMQQQKPPVRIICPGRAYRVDEADMTHSPLFHQVEGLVVDEGIMMSDLKGTLIHFLKALLGEDKHVRFRPSYFPFTEPSGEVDVSCVTCNGKGCPVCKGTGWMELGGCGMVHPHLFKMVGYDDENLSGFAFGMGIERLAMARFGITDMRSMFDNDMRFLAQF